MRLAKPSRGVLATLFGGLAVLFFCSDVLHNLDHWGQYDWDLLFFHAQSAYRSVAEFGELPLWNPWYLGGFPMIGNPQAAFPNPFFLFDLLVGPIVASTLPLASATRTVSLRSSRSRTRFEGTTLMVFTFPAGPHGAQVVVPAGHRRTPSKSRSAARRSAASYGANPPLWIMT